MFIKLPHRVWFTFCKFKYYKDLAKQINYILPKINEELELATTDRCWLIGYKLITKLTLTNTMPKQQQQNATANLGKQQSQIKEDIDQIQLEVDPLSRQELSFGSIRKYAQKNDMDVCMTDPYQKEVSLVKLREEIYRKFYYQRIFKNKSTAKKYKQIRVPQNIQEHDILTKVTNIRSMINKGDFRFNIYTENSSNKSEKAIKRLCQLLGRDPNIEIQEYQIKEKTKRRPNIVIQRWSAVLDFSSESKVNYQQVNKKWRRYLIDTKAQNQPKKHINQFNFDSLIQQPIQFQKQVVKEMRSLKIPMGKDYKDYEDIEDALSIGKQQFQRTLFEKEKYKLNNFGKTIKQKNTKSKQIIEQDKQENEQQQIQEQIQLQQIAQNQTKSNQNENEKSQNIEMVNKRNKMNQKQINEQDLKKMRKQLNKRTVQDILEQMQMIKGNKVELEAFDVYKIQILEEQLKKTLRLAGYKSKI